MTVAPLIVSADTLASEVLACLPWSATEDDVLGAVAAVVAAHQDTDEEAVLGLVLDELAVRRAETGDPQLN